MSTFIKELLANHKKAMTAFPDNVLAKEFIDKFFDFLFIPHPQRKQAEFEMEREFESLKSYLSTLIYDVVADGDKTQAIANEFFNEVPKIYKMLLEDAQAVLNFDPAAKSIEEVLVAYPGFYATAVYRFSHQLYKSGVKILPRFFSEYAHSKTGIDIHPGATISNSFFIDHGTGIVIGETTKIGKNVKIYQGVTLGALSVSKDKAKTQRHPTIEDNVTIYSGATILGGETIIGHDSVIGGNVWLTNSVLPFSVVYHKSEVTIRDKNPLPEALNFVI
ncbi:serine O-acetyltransferase EpsC [Ferruginibacter albus]|uniref:serine O-acetyltransferase EpsC n=1 Tax=Ferruginibacter albus TaxID=2875540 RepID=UPI001CC37AC7|nr:serine O-acetyltransferase EpsC [Ferruginibacter albus]UAY52981.1 serine O-acetyltransferase [Ferruginibacter albus]